MFSNAFRAVIGVFFLAASAAPAFTADWPTWRADPQRSGQWAGELADELHPQWVRKLPPTRPAYNNARLQFDAGYEPVAAAGRVFVASSANDRLTALDAASGEELWRFYAAGPIRTAPAIWQDRVYVGSDDGNLYCLKAADGELLWKYRPVQSTRQVLGNGRLISNWPVRGGPVIDDGVLYFAAGVWSFEGVFVCALDARSGSEIWVNDRCGFLYGQHPHDAKAFGGLTPQGYLLISGDELVVPCGTAVPARFDRKSGELKHFALPKQGRLPGSWFTAANRAQRRGLPAPEPSETDDESGLVFDSDVSREQHEGGEHRGAKEAGARSRVTINGREYAFADGYEGVEGTVHSIIAAEGRLLVSTAEGELHCFGPDPRSDADAEAQARGPAEVRDATDASGSNSENFARTVLEKTSVTAGFGLIFGIETLAADTAAAVRELEALTAETELQLTVIEADREKSESLRRQLDQAGLLGSRIAVHVAEPASIELPPYFASLVIARHARAGSPLSADEKSPPAEIAALPWIDSLRPYGGTAVIRFDVDSSPKPNHAASKDPVSLDASFVWQATDRYGLLRREGPLPGAVDYVDGWDSPDARVRAPLGVLWYDDSLAHFKRAPQPMIVDGLMVSYDKSWHGWTEGKRPPYPLLPPTYSDIYTGRILSEDEAAASAASLPSRDLDETQPQQYRPPSQQDDWKPAPPVIGTRVNPLNGRSEPRAIPKSYGCDGGVDYGSLYTLRSGTAAFYDKELESGTIHISGPRSGCTNSVIPAGGILNVPYFFQGCTCSYPLPVGLAMVSLPPEHEQWSVWGEGAAESVRRVGINFGAPGARMTPAGTLWLEYPQVGGPAPELDLTVSPEDAEPFYRHSLRIRSGDGWPWVAASGLEGITELTLAGLQEGEYTVRLHFIEPDAETEEGERVFDVILQDQTVLSDFDPRAAAGRAWTGTVREFDSVEVSDRLQVRLRGRNGNPVLSGIEIIAAGLPQD